MQANFYVRPFFLRVEFICLVGTLPIGGGDRCSGIFELVGQDMLGRPAVGWLLRFSLKGGWLTHGDLVLEALVDCIAVVEHRLIPARVRSEWTMLRGKGLATIIWAPASQESSHVGNAGVGVISMRGAPLSLPTFATVTVVELFGASSLLSAGRSMHLVVLEGYQGGNTDA